MNKETLEYLATKYGTTVEHLWSVLLRQVKIDTYFTIAVFIFMTILYVIVHRIFSKEEDSFYNEILKYILPILYVLIFILFAWDITLNVVNPEYQALQLLKH